PTVAKSAADATADRDFAWDIVLTNPLPAAQTLAVVDSDVTLMGVAGDGTCAPDFDADGRLACTVDAGGVATVTVSRAADGCEPSTEANALEGFSYLDEQGDRQPLAYSSTPVVASVPGDAEACWLPEVTKEGIKSIDGAYAWRITID